MRVPFVVPDCPRRAPWGRFIPSILLGGCLAWSGSARGAVFDYSGSLPVTASFNPPTVTYSVVDQGQVRPGSTTVPTGNVFNGTRRDDVVAWNDGATVYLRFYDPARTNWIGTNIAGNPFSLASANGVVAWSAGGFVFSWAYDRARGQWVAAPAVPTGGASVTALHTTNGVVAWATSTGSIFYQAYDPATRSWAQAGTGGAATSFLTLADGVVAWVSGSGTGTRVYYRTYDAARHAWREGQHAPGLSVSTFLNAQGMVVWYVAGLQPRVHVRIYDPVRDAWQAAEQATAQTFNLAIVNATATWSANNVSFLGGYNAHAGVWTNGHTAPYAYFVASTNRGDAPLPVYFADMSLGGSAWNWSFGDNTVTNTRSPFHRFTVFTNTTARLTVTGLLPSHSASLTITNDITPPAGQIVIEGGLSLTTNRVVRLDVAATDNSGVVAEMRFSNTNNQSWGPWGPFATNATWSLDAGVGTRTVFAQFRDRSGNVSALTNDTIELDTTPLRRAFFNPTNISALEAAGQITLEVLLEAPFTRPVAVQYTSVNGSAAAGSDFEPAAGTLVFAPGQTNATFPFRILDDNAVELNETLTFELTVISNALASPPFTFAILDEDPPSVGFAATGYSVGETSGVAVIHVHLSAPSGRDVWVGCRTTNGTATAGLDYAPVGSVLFFPAGITNASFAIAITNDTLDELSETIGLVLFNPTNATLGALREATLTIVDDDPPTARFSSASFTASETPANTVVNISVVLSKPPAQTVFVDWSVGGGSASPGADYFSTGTGTLTFGPGQTNKTFQLTLFTDTQTEGDETVEMRLIDFSGATRGTPDHAVLTILDDDSPPRILETTRPANDTFTMTLSGAVGQRFALELSTNLPLWRVYRVLTNHTGVLQFTDTFTPAAGVRFYRTAYPAP